MEVKAKAGAATGEVTDFVPGVPNKPQHNCSGLLLQRGRTFTISFQTEARS
jgi:hypothetical protein